MTNIRVKTPAFVPGFINVMDKLFNEDFQSAYAANTMPAVNILEKEKGYEILLMAPGLQKSDFNIALENDLLTISYEKKTEEQSDETKDHVRFIKKEFAFQSFKRSFTVNQNLNVEQISASYENGILTIAIPKVEVEVPKTKTININ